MTRELNCPQDKGLKKPRTEDLLFSFEPEFPPPPALRRTAWIAGKYGVIQGLGEVLAEALGWWAAAQKLEEG